MNNFDKQWKRIIKNIINNGIPIYNERSKHTCHTIFGEFMRFDLEEEFPLLSLRKIPTKVFIAEQLFYITGERKLDWLQQYTKIWNMFANKKNELDACYGERWKSTFGRDQLFEAIQLLEEKPGSRHAVIMMWDPRNDGLLAPEKPNVPCPYTFTLQRDKKRLHLHLTIRSNDMMLGNPHDVSGFALLNILIARYLGTKPGILSVSIANAHIYDIHIEDAKKLIKRKSHSNNIKLKAGLNDFGFAFNNLKKNMDKTMIALTEQFEKQYKYNKPIKMELVK